jgi:hypothetical protein
MIVNVRLAQLYALRAQIDAMIALEEAEFQAVAKQAGCPHPSEARRDITTMGTDRQFKCLACGETVKGVA